ncbi:MAG: DUF5818 domain-containing protein [Bryobacteraceae bacterium]|nr:DUF5818 domain-containing protein [Bryobacteraceae bacterium]
MKKIVLSMPLAAALLLAQAKTYTGVITDTMCGKDHAHMGNSQPIEECVKACVKAGKDKYALLTPDGKLYKLSDQKAPEAFAAKKVKVTGTLYAKTGVLKVDKIEAAK